MSRGKDNECEEKRDIWGVIQNTIKTFLEIVIFIFIFILFGSSILSKIKHYKEWDLPSNLHSKPYASSAKEWKNPPPSENQSGGAVPIGLAGMAASKLAREAARNKMKQQRARVGSGSRSRNDLVFPYDLINGNEVGDWFSRTVAMTMSKHNGWLKFGLDKLNQTMYPQDNSKGFIGKLKKWIYLIIAWIVLIISQIVWMYNTTLSYFTGWGPLWSNMWLFSDIYPNSFIFHNIPFLTAITSALLITITSTYQYLTGFAFLAFSAYFSSGNAFNYATDEFQSYFSFKGIVFSLLIITAISLGFNCWSDCIENRDKAAADIFGKISLGICAISAFFVYYHEGKELVKKSFVKAVLKK
tara:strand:- start:288 stop:1355 length:1068 start_codon:yes stop_codon:yes gene_type:complete